MRDKLIRTILHEYIESKIGEWQENISDFGDVFATPIAVNSENGERLYLFVGLSDSKTNPEYKEFSYSFVRYGKDNVQIGDFMTNRTEVKQYLPKEILGQRQILPIIYNLTRKLLNKMLPDKIIRQTEERLSGTSLNRYEEITKIMVNEYGYEVIDSGVSYGNNYWKLSRKTLNEHNKNMDNLYVVGIHRTVQQIAYDTFAWAVPLVKFK